MLNDKMLYTTILLMVTVHGKEFDDGSSKYEYMEVFNNIPRMFEYFLNRVAEKPEMLEKNDITVFIKGANVNHHDYGKSKRNVYCETEQFIGTNKYEVKREVDSLDESKCFKSQSKRETERNFGNKLSDEGIQIKKTMQKERDTNTTLKNISQYCYNNGVVSNCSTDSKSADTNTKKNTETYSYDVTNIETPGQQYNFSHKRTSEKSYFVNAKNSVDKLNKLFRKVKMNKRDIEYLANKNSKTDRRRSPVADFEVSHLNPEEIEDAALLMEQMLEEYNNNQPEEVE